MDREELYELLDIEGPQDFKYFDNMAALLESDEEIEYHLLSELLENVDREMFTALVEEYFDEITDFIPGSEAELFTILDNEKNALMGMARNLEENSYANLTDEFDRFRRWYSMESKVYVNEVGELEEMVVPVKEAITLARLEELGEGRYYYDFSECLDYKLDDYIMSFKDMIAMAEEDEDE